MTTDLLTDDIPALKKAKSGIQAAALTEPTNVNAADGAGAAESDRGASAGSTVSPTTQLTFFPRLSPPTSAFLSYALFVGYVPAFSFSLQRLDFVVHDVEMIEHFCFVSSDFYPKPI
jgi:hypothetical protein